jgi:hypothetical protein
MENYKIEYYDDRWYKGTDLIENLPIPVNKINPNWVILREKDCDIYHPSVTTILGKSNPMPFLATWRGDVGNLTADYIIRNALDLGSHVHQACEHYAKGFPIVYVHNDFPTKEMLSGLENIFYLKSQEATIMVNRFEKLLELFKPKIKAIELQVFQLQENIVYAGTLDYIMEIEAGTYELSSRTKVKLKGGKYVVDLKSGKSTDNEMFLQTSAYTKCLNDNDIVGNLIWHVNADRRTGIIGANVLVCENIESYYEQFLNFYKTFLFKNADIKPKLYEYSFILQRKITW